MEQSQNDGIRLAISPALAEKLDRALITEEDARRTILHCETTGLKLLDEDSGDFVGHLRSGALTYWVRYRFENGVYRLLSIYCHRAVLEEASGS